MRLLIINPNTTAAMTEKMAAMARHLLPDVEVVASTGRFGPAYIASRAASAIAAHVALDCFARDGAGADVVLLGCFGDPGLDALKEIAPVPVLGLADACMADAARLGGRFAVVTGGERWGPMLREFAAARGHQENLLDIYTVAPTGGDIARDPAGAMAVLAEACNRAAEAGAGSVILGGAGLAGLAAGLQPAVRVPVLCSVEVGIRAAGRMLAEPPAKPASGDFARTPPVPVIGVSPELAALFTAHRAN